MDLFLKQRRRTSEWMDEDAVDAGLLDASLRFIQRINKYLGYTRATVGHLERFSRSWRRGQIVRILDVATGSADVPHAILCWADRRGWDVRIIGVDRHALTAQAATASPDPRLDIVRADALRLPFDDGAVDYAMTSMFLHHLDEDAAVRVMAELNRVARRGVIVADLLRGVRPYLWASLFTLLSNPMVRHDGRASVAQAFNRREITGLRDRAGVEYARYHRHFGHRFVLAGEKGEGT